MTRVHFVKKARKDNPALGVKAGESYYWWAFRFGGKHASKTEPTPRQLTQNEFALAVMDLEDELAGVVAIADLDSVADAIESLADEQEEKRDNMPDSLQDGEVGSLLGDRADALRDWANEIRDVEEPEREEGETHEQLDERTQEALSEAQSTSYGGP